MAIIALLDKVCQENHPEKEIFNLLLRVLDDINTQKASVNIIFLYFLFQLSKTLGFQLTLSNSSSSLYNPIHILIWLR